MINSKIEQCNAHVTLCDTYLCLINNSLEYTVKLTKKRSSSKISFLNKKCVIVIELIPTAHNLHSLNYCYCLLQNKLILTRKSSRQQILEF